MTTELLVFIALCFLVLGVISAFAFYMVCKSAAPAPEPYPVPDNWPFPDSKP